MKKKRMDINQRLTEELKKQILAAETLVAVEDLYRPSIRGCQLSIQVRFACIKIRPVSPISSKAPHTCDNREGERT